MFIILPQLKLHQQVQYWHYYRLLLNNHISHCHDLIIIFFFTQKCFNVVFHTLLHPGVEEDLNANLLQIMSGDDSFPFFLKSLNKTKGLTNPMIKQLVNPKLVIRNKAKMNRNRQKKQGFDKMTSKTLCTQRESMTWKTKCVYELLSTALWEKNIRTYYNISSHSTLWKLKANGSSIPHRLVPVLPFQVRERNFAFIKNQN